MNGEKHTWVVILAAGEGTRLKRLTAASDGTHIPKQFCSIGRDRTLLHDALDRAARVAPMERIMVVVAREHRRWWQTVLADLPNGNVIVQSCNRGTGNGVLLALLHLQRRDPDGTAVFLPADHFIRDEAIISRSLSEGIDWSAAHPTAVLLLGMTPSEADPELGYIVPCRAGDSAARRVHQFVEKPALPLAQRLLQQGSVWNSFMFVACVRALLKLFNRRHGEVVDTMRLALKRVDWAANGGEMIGPVYETLPIIDFSRHVAEGAEDVLHVLPVPACGWTDLGTPKRVGECVVKLNFELPAPRAQAEDFPYLNLASAYTRLGVAI